jgi:hypothetical protein
MGPFAVPPALRFHRRELSVPFGIGYYFHSKVLILRLFYALFSRLSRAWRRAEKNSLCRIAILKGDVPPGDMNFTVWAKGYQIPPAEFAVSRRGLCV